MNVTSTNSSPDHQANYNSTSSLSESPNKYKNNSHEEARNSSVDFVTTDVESEIDVACSMLGPPIENDNIHEDKSKKGNGNKVSTSSHQVDNDGAFSLSNSPTKDSELNELIDQLKEDLRKEPSKLICPEKCNSELSSDEVFIFCIYIVPQNFNTGNISVI